MVNQLDIVKTKMLQKLGKATKSAAPETYEETREDFLKIEGTLSKLIKSTKSYCQKAEKCSKLQTEMGEAFVEVGLADQSNNSEMFIKMGEALKSLSIIQHAMLVNIIEKYLKPTMEFEKQFEVGRKFHKKYTQKLSEYDAQVQLISTLKAKKEPDQAKITQAINLLSQIEDSRNDAFVEAEFELQRQIQKSKTDYINNTCELFSCFHHWFAESYTLSSELVPEIDKGRDRAKKEKDNKLEKKEPPKKEIMDGYVPSPSATTGGTITPTTSSNSLASVSNPNNGMVMSSNITRGGISLGPSIATPTQDDRFPPHDKAIGFGTAKYPYDAQEENELTMKEGELVTIYLQEGDWWLVAIRGKKGFVPSNYLGDIQTVPGGATATPSSSKKSQPTSTTPSKPTANTNKVVKALYDYEAADGTEMTFQEGDQIEIVSLNDGTWIQGKNKRTGKTGLFPANYTDYS